VSDRKYLGELSKATFDSLPVKFRQIALDLEREGEITIERSIGGSAPGTAARTYHATAGN
jgi:hypothetical protein